MKRWPVYILLVLSVIPIMIFGSACASDLEEEQPATQKPAVPQRSYLEKLADDIGVTKLEDGHLLVEGNTTVRFLRLLTYFNEEAKAKRGNGEFSSYRISGTYGGSPTPGEGYTDFIEYRIQLSPDDFHPPVDLAKIMEDFNLKFVSSGYLAVEKGSPYKSLNALLVYRNAEAANLGRKYKIKAWYDAKEREETIVSDRVDAMIQFSFDLSFSGLTPDFAIYARNASPLEEKQKSIIAATAIEFSQILEKPEILTIMTLDFSGDTENDFDWAYIFDEDDIEILKDIYEGKKDWSTLKVLALAEVKRVAWQANGTGSGASLERSSEPIGEEAIEIVAYIISESIRVMNPTRIEIAIHEFRGESPNQLNTWVYQFDSEAVEMLKNAELSPALVIREASVVEIIGFVPGNRNIINIPPVKQAIP